MTLQYPDAPTRPVSWADEVDRWILAMWGDVHLGDAAPVDAGDPGLRLAVTAVAPKMLTGVYEVPGGKGVGR